jgi:dolichol-phosphate mannosyltransferase
VSPTKKLELAVVVPTFQERDNIAPVLQRLAEALDGVEYEVIFVDDDSPDGTAAAIRIIGIADHRIRVLQRVHRRGLASACVEGMMSTSAPFIAVMDADLQHDETILPEMLARLKSGNLDIAVGTRNAAGGSMGEFSASRVRLSNFGRRLGNFASRSSVSDPMSGFFMMTRPFLDEVVHSVSGIGFKILLDVLASADRPVRIVEVPYRFGNRVYGESKLDILVGLEYLQLLLDKLVGDYVPVRFLIFGIVGALGVVVHLSILYILLNIAQVSFVAAQTSGTILVMTLNFFLNNAITYRDRRLRGRQLIRGLVSFYIACSIGAFLNIRAATFVLDTGWKWYVAGMVGVTLSSVWNFAVTAVFTWRDRRNAIRPRTLPVAGLTQPELPFADNASRKA